MDIIKGLEKVSAYPHDVSSVNLIETHISWVFLTGDFAYKVKKPVNFGFLDFTTLKKRKYYCEKELEVNRRISPDLYIGLVSIVEYKDEIFIDSKKGDIIEYAIKMKQMPQESIMTELIKNNKIKKGDIDKISEIISKFHDDAKSGRGVDKYGRTGIIKKNWFENFSQTENLPEDVLSKEHFDFIKKTISRFISDNYSFFEKRILENRIKECHGDLHSGNIFIKDSRIWIFDAIEFNPRFSCSDVASEIAFLAIDLDFHGRHYLSDYFIERYIEYSKDEELLELLNFYKCYRAYVRGKVTSFRLGDDSISEPKKEAIKKLAKKYFELSYNYAQKKIFFY